jgi:uncharacterized protein DUF4735
MRAAVMLAVVLSACAPEAGLSAEDQAIADGALEYLGTTEDEMGVDVLVILSSYGQLADDPRAFEIVDARRSTARPEDLALFGALIDIDKRAFEPSTLDGVAPPADTPDPAAVDDRVQGCVLEMLSCTVSAECSAFAELDSWGYVLTHQAVWLLFAHWLGCAIPLDADALRHRYAARLVAEAAADPVPSDLFFERLGVLGHLGFGDAIDPAWLDALRASQEPTGCFPADDAVRCHPHPTVLALWALIHGSGR